MHPFFVVAFLVCGGWFFGVAAQAGRGIGVRIGLGVLGIAEFVVVMAIVERLVRDQRFFRRALASGPDIGPIMTYIALPSLVLVLLTGLWLRRRLDRRGPANGGRSADASGE